MRAGTPSWPMRTPTCRSRVAESLSRRRCIISCDSTAATECTPDIYRVIPASHGCVRMPEQYAIAFFNAVRSGLPSLCSAGRQSIATTQANRNQVFSAVHVSAHSWVRAFRLRLRRNVVAVNVTQTIVSARRDQIWQTGLSASPLLSGWWWRWRSWARSKAGQDQPEY